MSDLISRSALLEKLNLLARYENEWRQTCILGVCKTIEYAPAVDAVPVVRCGKCAHTETDGCEVPAIYCKKWDRWEMPEDFFCAYGERKENETD